MSEAKLPVIGLPTSTEEVGGMTVTFRSLSRSEALKFTTEFRGKADEAETYLLACGMGISLEEAQQWRETTPPAEAGKVIDGIVYLSGLATRAVDEDGEEVEGDPSADPQS